MAGKREEDQKRDHKTLASPTISARLSNTSSASAITAPQSDKAALERVLLGHRLAIEIGEPSQRDAIGNPFAQFAIIPVLDPHENQRAQDLPCREPLATVR